MHLAWLQGCTRQWTIPLGVGWRAWIFPLTWPAPNLWFEKGHCLCCYFRPQFRCFWSHYWGSGFFYRLDWQLRGTNLLYSGATKIWCWDSANRHLHFSCAFHSSRGTIVQILWPLQFHPVWWSECGENHTKSFLNFLASGFPLALGTSKSHSVQGNILASISACCKMSIFSSTYTRICPGDTEDVVTSQDPPGSLLRRRQESLCPATGVWYCRRKAGTRLGGCGAPSQVKKVSLERRSIIPQNTAKRLLTITTSGGLWDPGDLQVPPAWQDTRSPLSFAVSRDIDTSLPTQTHTHMQSRLSWPQTEQQGQKHRAGTEQAHTTPARRTHGEHKGASPLLPLWLIRLSVYWRNTELTHSAPTCSHVCGCPRFLIQTIRTFRSKALLRSLWPGPWVLPAWSSHPIPPHPTAPGTHTCTVQRAHPPRKRLGTEVIRTV